MSEERIVKDQAGEGEGNDSADVKRGSGVTRRDFLQKSMMVASGLALTSMLPSFTSEQWATVAQAASCPPVGQPLVPIMEIKRSKTNNTLKAVLKMLNENKSYLAPSAAGGGKTACNSGQMRFFSGYDVQDPGTVWPGKAGAGVPNPGPTLRARVGDTVQITLLNQVDVSKFGNSIDVAETGGTCDVSKSVGPDGKTINTYPGDPSFENPPDCFHGSSSANLHFHGTHVSPRSISDNVLVNIRPSPRDGGKPVVDEEYVKADFDKIFADCSAGHSPEKWTDLPQTWRDKQQGLLQEYDKTAPWQNGRGLPPEQQLWLQDEMEIDMGQWPQYYIGAYPNCFKIPEWNGQPTSMGQAPGTHWYHGHKHGSTALNLANGMAGALIIEGASYDDALESFYTKQVVIVLQQYGAQVNLMKSGNPNSNKDVNADLVFVNGGYTPLVPMKPNEMQLWRIVNACHQKALPLDPPTDLKWVQTAQDGVQFDPGTSTQPGNYNPAVTNASFPVPAKYPTPPATPPALPSSTGSLAPANRIDLLVLAPSKAGTYAVTYGGGKALFAVSVQPDPNHVIKDPMPFPTIAQFPKMPGFLVDIDPDKVTVRRELHFASVADPSSPKPAQNRGVKPPYAPPKHTINGKQFDSHIDQAMLLGATEEWTMYNDSPGAAHPFHIHINPFQVTEILNPAVSKNPVKLAGPWIWWDNFAIPPAAIPPDGDGKTQVSGYFKMLTRFVDFTGMYVLHCHILGHEDRGMMQLIEVVTNTTTMQHK